MWTYAERTTGRYVKVAYHDPQRGWIPTKPGLPVPEGVVHAAPAGSWVVLGDHVQVIYSDHNFGLKYRELNDDEVVDVALRSIAVVSAECYADPAGAFWEKPTANADAQTLALSAIASVLWRRQMGR